MSHGTDGDVIYGSDRGQVRLTEVKDLLSPGLFPQMSGKPKFVIIQACSGSKYTYVCKSCSTL